MRVPRGQQFGLRSRASGRLHGTPCLSRISETPKDFDHTIVSTFGRTAAPPVRPLFLQPRLSLLPHRRRRPPKTHLCVILFWIPQCPVHCTPPPHRLAVSQAAQPHLVDENTTHSAHATHSPAHALTPLRTHLTTHALWTTPTRPLLSPHGPGTRETLRHLAFLDHRVVDLTCRNTKRT